MAIFIEFLQYKKSFPWYKRICFPLLLSQKEVEDCFEKFGKPQTSLERAQDRVFFAWNNYMNTPDVPYYFKQRAKRYFDAAKINLEYEKFKLMTLEEKEQYFAKDEIQSPHYFEQPPWYIM